MKLELLFILFSALVRSSFETNDYVVFCSVAQNTRVAKDCLRAVPDICTTMEHLITKALRNCVLEVADEDVDIVGMYPAANRELRAVNMIPQQRILHQCDTCCCDSQVCQTIGWCGSSDNCSDQSCERRLKSLSVVTNEGDFTE
jgi:hypothetical protein